MQLTPEEIIAYKARLEAAENAYHQVMIGGAATEFRDQNGEMIRYSRANSASLLNYINSLRHMLGMCPFVMVQVSRPAGVFFG